MNFILRFVVVAAGLSLAACFNNDHIDVANMTPTGTALQSALHQEYSSLSRVEYDEGDWHDGYTFLRKARASADGQDVGPEKPWDWDVPADTYEELHDAWDALGYWRRMGAAERVPALMAKAQASYDCWIQEQEENYQPDDIAGCRDAYYGAIADIENGMKWQPDAGEPMAMPGATPRPAVAPEAVGKPRFYTIFFDWDKSDINPIAQRVVDAIVADWGSEAASLELVGHADRSGGDDYNQALSERRVGSVTQALGEQGIGSGRVSGYGVGESDPAVPTADGVREPRNRRVVVTVQ